MEPNGAKRNQLTPNFNTCIQMEVNGVKWNQMERIGSIGANQSLGNFFLFLVSSYQNMCIACQITDSAGEWEEGVKRCHFHSIDDGAFNFIQFITFRTFMTLMAFMTFMTSRMNENGG